MIKDFNPQLDHSQDPRRRPARDRKSLVPIVRAARWQERERRTGWTFARRFVPGGGATAAATLFGARAFESWVAAAVSC